MSTRRLPHVGAPVVYPHDPLEGTPSARFHAWVLAHRERVQEMLERLTIRWSLFGSFVEINFFHPEVGPAGALVLRSAGKDSRQMRRRAERLRVIPLRELRDYVPRWERGETVEVAVEEMREELARRYSATPIRWSLNVPVHVEATWVGVVGAVTDERGFPPRAVAGCEALAEVLMREFAADAAWASFRQLSDLGKRFLHLLP